MRIYNLYYKPHRNTIVLYVLVYGEKAPENSVPIAHIEANSQAGAITRTVKSLESLQATFTPPAELQLKF